MSEVRVWPEVHMMTALSDGQPGNCLVDIRTAPRLEDSAVLNRVVEELREIDRRSGIARTLAIGELVLKRFFCGDPVAWRDRRRNKNNSIRRLANHQDCPLSRSALNEAIGVYVAVLSMPCVRTFGHIYASHVACVLALPIEERESMLETAERERWSVRELHSKVVLSRRARGERRGRPSSSADTRAVSGVRAVARELARGIGRVEQVSNLAPDQRAVARQLGGEITLLGARLARIADAVPDARTVAKTTDALAGVGNS